ncbi:MAG: aspartate--ammonia ligase [Mycoplasmataceae bacterium]|nr:aspartate--ammonia ligase [Mycoplasmataceae bacterium]
MYENKLNKIELEKMVMMVKTTFVKYIEKNLNLLKISSPLFLDQEIGLNDHLTGDGKPVLFHYKKSNFEIIQSLAKWKRQEIKNLEFSIGEGLWTNMKAIRTGETSLSPYHSLYVEQFDWEKRISQKDRTVEYLKNTVKQIYESIKSTLNEVQELYPFLTYKIPNEITFITTEELYKMYPKLGSKERENKFAKESKAFFLLGIGHKLSHNKPHDDRAPDYDDWNLNGDLILYNKIHDNAMELSSMGIRVDAKALKLQNKIASNDKSYDYHIDIENENLPFTIGGGIGQSRLVLFILEKYHIGEFQRSFWPKEVKEQMAVLGITLK